MKKKILLIHPSHRAHYQKSILKNAVPSTPYLSLATIGGEIKRYEDYEAELIDMNLQNHDDLKKKVETLRPYFVCITVVTPLIEEAKSLCKLIKSISKETIIIGGGPHISVFPKKTLQETEMDIGVIGEGDFTIREILELKDLETIKGISYKKNNEVFVNEKRQLIENLDELAFPDWSLYDLSKYKTSKLSAKHNPVGWLETSRGCPFNCVYCFKDIFGFKFREKSAKRVIDEIKYMLNLGFKEIYIADDCFNSNLPRAKEICDLIIKEKLKFTWSTETGIRVDRVDEEFFEKIRKAGCYRVYFGIESGNQEILNKNRKGTTLAQIKNAVKLAKKAKLEVIGFFMIGLLGESIQSMKDTISFAKKLDLDFAMMSFTTPIPGSDLYRQLDEQNLILTKEWSKYNLYIDPEKIYTHPDLKWDEIKKYYKKFYRSFYFRPGFMMKRVYRSLKNGSIIEELKALFSTKW